MSLPEITLLEQDDIDNLLNQLEDLVESLPLSTVHKESITKSIQALENDIYDWSLCSLENDDTRFEDEWYDELDEQMSMESEDA